MSVWLMGWTLPLIAPLHYVAATAQPVGTLQWRWRIRQIKNLKRARTLYLTVCRITTTMTLLERYETYGAAHHTRCTGHQKKQMK